MLAGLGLSMRSGKIRSIWSRKYAAALLMFSVALLGAILPSSQSNAASPIVNAVYSETSPSWNPAVSCFANVTTIENVIDLAGSSSFNTTTGGAIYLAGGFLLAGTSNSNPQSWPFDKRSLNPPCSVNVNSQVIPTFVEIHNIDLVFATDQRDCNQSKPGLCDTTFNLQDPSCPGFKTGHSLLCEVYVEIDQTWKFAGTAPPPVTNNTSVRIDIQGFVYWDPNTLSDKSHNFSGWEIHSLTAWRFSSKSTPNDFYLASYPGMVHVPAGRSSSATITIGSLSATAKGTVFLNGIPDVTTGLTATFSPSQVSLVALGTQSSTRTAIMTVQTGSGLSPGLHQILVVNGTDSTHFVAVTVQVPEFFITPQPPVLFPYNPGGSATITVTSLNQFSGNVNVSVAPYVFSNQNLTISPHWAVLSVTSGSSVSQQFQLTSSTPQAYEANVTALCSGCTVAQSDSYILDVNATDFHLTTSPTVPVVVKIGSSVKTTIRIASVLGFTGNVVLTDRVLRNGISATLNSSAVLVPQGGTAGASMNVSAPYSAAPGAYTVQLNSTFGPLVHSVNVLFDVGVPITTTVLGADNGLYWNSLSNGTWIGWNSLVGSASSPPALCTSGPQSLEVVVQGSGGGVYHKTLFANGTSTLWDTPGGSTIDQPACAVINGALYVVARGASNGTYLNTFLLKTRVWSSSGWQFLSGWASSAPVLVATLPNRLDLMIRGTNNGIYHMEMATGTWPTVFVFPWDSPGGTTNASVAAISDGTALQVVVKGADNGIYYNNLTLSTGSWAGWAGLNGATATMPAIALDSSGTLHVVATGLDHVVYHKMKPKGGSWSAWDSPGGSTPSTVSISTVGPDVELILRGTDNGIYFTYLATSGWANWTALGGVTLSKPSLATTF